MTEANAGAVGRSAPRKRVKAGTEASAPKRGVGGNHSVTHTMLRQSVCQLIEVLGGYHIPMLGGIGMRKGTPDVLVCIRGRFVAVECKTGTAVLDANQCRQRDWIVAAGGLHCECRRIEDLEARLVDAGLMLKPMLGV